ncbi:MAG: DUF4215 domain-containing protein, partial [Bradymonadales bacterium]
MSKRIKLIFLSSIVFALAAVGCEDELSSIDHSPLYIGEQRNCGNGVLDPGEECDDGNKVANDGCTNCKLDTELCGNGELDAGEVCDDGNRVSGDGCSADCLSDESCGN